MNDRILVFKMFLYVLFGELIQRDFPCGKLVELIRLKCWNHDSVCNINTELIPA